MVPAFSVSAKTLLLLSAGCHLTVTSRQKGGGSSLTSLGKETNPIHESLALKTSKKAPPPNIITLEYKLVEGGYKYSDYGRERGAVRKVHQVNLSNT